MSADRIDEMRAKVTPAYGILEDTMVSGCLVAELLDRAEELRTALQGLLEWREQPEAHSDATLAWAHGRRFTDEQTKRLHGYWGRAEAALAKLEAKP